MDKEDYFVILLFIAIIVCGYLALSEIYNFMPIIKTCDDDFAIINKCGCVPCSWSDADKYTLDKVCLPTNVTDIKK